MNFGTVFVSVLLCAAANAASCPDGFEGHQNSCYYFSHGKETWVGAFETCRLFGAMLVEVNDMVEDNYLSGKMSNNGGKWWIGLTDKLIEGEYVWETSMTVLQPGDYTGWGDGEPNNSNGENCVYYSENAGFKWVDSECYHTAQYICEINEDVTEIVG